MTEPAAANTMTADPPAVVLLAEAGPVAPAGSFTADPVQLDLRQAQRLKLIEWTASSLAWGVLATFAATILVFGIYGIAGDTGNALELLKTVLPVVSTPLGIALGYYFTRQRGD